MGAGLGPPRPHCTRALSRDVQGAGSAGLILLTQQACPCVPAQSCPAGSRLPAPGLMCPPTLHSLPVGLLVPTLPPGDAGAPGSPQGQGVKAPLDGRAALCSILPAPPSGPAEHVCPIPPGRGVPFFGQGDPRAGAEPLAGFSFRPQGLSEAGGAAQPTFCQVVCPFQGPCPAPMCIAPWP